AVSRSSRTSPASPSATAWDGSRRGIPPLSSCRSAAVPCWLSAPLPGLRPSAPATPALCDPPAQSAPPTSDPPECSCRPSNRLQRFMLIEHSSRLLHSVVVEKLVLENLYRSEVPLHRQHQLLMESPV